MIAAEDIFAAVEATWPAVSCQQLGPWIIREGGGGGSRVSATTAMVPIGAGDLKSAEDAMQGLGQDAIFMVRSGDDKLDIALDQAGYVIKDPVVAYVGTVQDLAKSELQAVTTFRIWPPMAVQREIWAEGGIGPARLAIMERASEPKVALLGRVSDAPAGTAFVGCHGDLAMVHALEVKTNHRRKGLGRHLMTAAAYWAQDQSARYLSVLVTKANSGANALYQQIGMQPVARYHYRGRPPA